MWALARVTPVLELPLALRIAAAGVLRFTRNPMYLGFALLLAGWAAWLAAPAALLGPAVFVAFLNRFQILPEERALRARFGSEDVDYAARVRRWL